MTPSHSPLSARIAAALLCAAAPLAFAQTASKPAAATAHSDLTPLHTGWQLASGCKVTDAGDTISSASYKPSGWTATTVPSTILAAQVAAGQVKDPDYGMNLRSAPGMTTMTPPPPPPQRPGGNANANAGRGRPAPVQNPDGSWPTYNIGANFSTMPTPVDSPYHCAWWYRTEFKLPATDKSKVLWLRIGGVNYRANVWLNGQRVADSNQIQGAFQTFDLNVTSAAKPGQQNVLAIETFGPTENDLTISWADWSPDPPDKEMGLWEGVSLATTGPVAITDPAVTTHFPDASLKQADLSVYAELRNGTGKPVHGTLSATVAGVHVEQPVDLAANEDRSIVFAPSDYPKLKIQNPRVWWPWQMGQPNLETATLRFTANGQLSDEVSQRFGIREVTDELTDPKGCDVPPPHPPDYVPSEAEVNPPPRNPTAQANNSVAAQPRARRDTSHECADIAHRLYKINGKPILIRGGGYAPDMLLRDDPAKLAQEFRMVRDMGLNTIRSEGKMVPADFLNLADEKGVLVMIGWTCCDRYERWRNWTPENQTVAVASLHSQILRLRPHPSVFVWLNGSDNPPPANIEHLYLDEEAKLHWPNPTLSSATAKPTSVTGESGVKMNGPYDFVAPSYWTDPDPTHKFGGAWGFSTEIGPGPAIVTLDSARKFMTPADIWPRGEVWSFHNAGGGFAHTTKFDAAMDNSYGPTTTAADYNQIAQAMAYDGERAMFEAYTQHKYTSTGVIQWMLNNSWPSNFWHLYDYYLGTGGGYFGTKKADEPLHIQYAYDTHAIWVINSTYKDSPELTAHATVYDNNLKQLFDKSASVSVPADGTAQAIPIDASVFSGAPLYFVSLKLTNKAGEVLSRNFYWVSARKTVFNWNATNYTGTTPSQYEDMTALRSLPQAKVEASAHIVNGRAEVHLHNPSSALAFQLRVWTDPTSQKTEAFPVLWSDNFIELLPGESVTLSAQLAPTQHDPAIHLTGWNIPPQTIHPTLASTRSKPGE